MKEIVIAWLKNGANAQEGIRLMEQSGVSPLTLRLVRSNPSGNKRMMVAFLCKKYNINQDFTTNWKETEITFSRKPKSFREEFSFLIEKSCPVELEALASRKFSRYHAYVELHFQLRDCTDLNQCTSVSRQLIDSYIENRMIWDELNYYQQNKSLLGKHPIFNEFKRRKELLGLPIKELVKRQKQIENNIWRVTNELNKGDKPHLDIERRERLAGYKAELEEVNRLLE